jgi:hypothetical protein
MAELTESGVQLPPDSTGKVVDTVEVPYRSSTDGSTQYKEIQSVIVKNDQGEIMQFETVAGSLANIENWLERIAFILEARA